MITARDWDLRQLKARLTSKLNTVHVGVFDHTPHESENIGERRHVLSVFELAIIHEFGTAHIPARSFLGSTFHAKQGEFKVKVQKLAHSIYLEKITIEEAIKELGQWGVDNVRETIRDNIAPPLAQATIDRKGSDLALVETTQLYFSIDYRFSDE